MASICYASAGIWYLTTHLSSSFHFLFWPKRRDWTKKNMVLALGSLRKPCSLNNTQFFAGRFFAAELLGWKSEGKGLEFLQITEKQIEINYHLPSTSILSQIQSFDRFIIESRWMRLIVVVGWTTQWKISSSKWESFAPTLGVKQFKHKNTYCPSFDGCDW